MRNVYNFSARPAVLPELVLQEAADEMLDYKGSGMSVMEISHRSSLFQSIIDETEQDLRTLMNIPDDYVVLFLQGGTSLQFSMIPMNFMRNGKADYILTGYWAKKAYEEAKQKNLAPAGLVIAIMHKDLISDTVLPNTPIMLQYKIHADKKSLYNTPPAYNIYMAGKVLKWIQSLGGLEKMKEINKRKASILYDYLDSSSLFYGLANAGSRSLMNVTFRTKPDAVDAEFIKQAEKHGIVSIKGHRAIGGMRASLYNAMPIEGVQHLVDFMREFENSGDYYAK